jgi:hypothetical protein
MITKELAYLDEEEATLLPERNTLGLFDVASILASNSATSVQALTLLSASVATASQSITVVQV